MDVHIELFRGSDGLWYFRLKAPNGEVVSASEGYYNRADALRTAQNIRPDAEVEELE